MTGDNVYHVYPVNDSELHSLQTERLDKRFMVYGEIRAAICSQCKCNPTVQYTENEGVLIIHNSFDCREGLEQVNEILNNFI